MNTKLRVIPLFAMSLTFANSPAPALAQSANEAPEQPKACCSKANRAEAIRAATDAQPASQLAQAMGPDDASRQDVVSPVRLQPDGMVWIPGGEFAMGSTDPLARPDESPKHRVRVDGFFIDLTEVTNGQFAEFVQATGYKTVAERPVDWDELKKQVAPGTPKPPDEQLQPGSLVFTPPDHPVDTRDYFAWWTWTLGASWRHPEGPSSSIDGKENYPVVQVAYEDVIAYCRWSGKRLPTEAEWEFAARGGLEGKVNVWGDEPIDPKRANTWQGHFPDKNTVEDGFALAAPVKSFPPNGYGLFDMAGNVWEWCSDLYRPDAYALLVAEIGPNGVAVNPKGPTTSFDPRNPHSPESRVHRGGSFLCNDSYCASYRPSARMACPPDTGLQHLGFRCVMTTAAWQKEIEKRVSATKPTLHTKE